MNVEAKVKEQQKNVELSSKQCYAERIAKNEQCTAVSCSFMEGICLWDLGPGWKSDSHGSVSIELKTFSTSSVSSHSSPLPLSITEHSQIVSALFRPPVASYVDFDLWLSNNVKFVVAEQTIPPIHSTYLNEDVGEEKEILKLFEREGATDGGWHRFRVPLRPSFLPVRLLFIVELILLSKEGEEGFVSLSNIKLVNNEGIEIGCQTLEDKLLFNYSLKTTTTTLPFIKEDEEEYNKDNIKEYERKLLADAGIEWLAQQPTPLRLPSLTLNDQYLQSTPPPTQFTILPIPSTFPPFITKQTIPKYFSNSILQKGSLTIPTKTFNPFQPLFEGIAPIIPLQGNPQRLTALMDKQNINVAKNNNLLKPKNSIEIEKPLKTQQMLYGATPIGTYSNIEHEEEDEEDDERGDVEQKEGGLLPFGVKEKMENEENNTRRKENSELTLTPNEQKNVMEDLNKDVLDEDNKMPSLFSSSHHRGWSERLEKDIKKD
uniref:MAM domain-containing protein n=1 Tax=Meloidogyne hapla TaxID=6305 RepID=A0A1I8BYI3_MELHA